MTGQLPGGSGVPSTLARSPVAVTSTWTSTKTLVSPLPSSGPGLVLPALGATVLLAGAVGLGALWWRRRFGS